MPQDLPDTLLEQLSEFVAGRMGLHFPRERWRDLERGIRSVAPAFGAKDAVSCAEWLLSASLTKAQIETLASELTVGETYFFRENRSFDLLAERILPELVRSRFDGDRRLRVWSAGCCTGEEAYSIAILLDRVLPAPREWRVTILATDINPRFLRKAAEGIYGEWSFRKPPAWLKGQYFTAAGEHKYEILPRIKKMVTFSSLNLAEDSFPSLSNNTNAMDLIFCRNVLMYFEPDRARKVIGNFHRSLVEGGKLIVSPTETSVQLFSQFTYQQTNGVVVYGKGGSKPPEPPMAPFPWEATARREGIEPAVPEIPADVIPGPGLDLIEAPHAAESAPVYEEALALFERGDYAGAASKLDAGQGVESTPETCALMARICANLGRLDEGRTWAEKAIAGDKMNAGLHYLRAIILQEEDTLEESAASLKRTLYLDPDFVLAHYALGNLALRQHRHEESGRHFSNALALLDRCQPDEVLPQSDGLAAGRLREMIQSSMAVEVAV